MYQMIPDTPTLPQTTGGTEPVKEWAIGETVVEHIGMSKLTARQFWL